ncbi:MAG: nicotinate (nicotinamide) nucleotide adenylyltransferase [Planctomycetota bacterium]
MGARHGIFGGSFDPVHRGHEAAVRALVERRGPDRLYVVPAGRPPHKREGCRAPFADRVEMARLAVAGLPRAEVLSIEEARAGPSYTVDTVDELCDRHPGAALELYVGADMLADLPGWREAGRLVGRVSVIAFARPGQDLEAARRAFEDRLGPLPEGVLEIRSVDVSSTEIRRRLAAGEPVEGLLSPPVEAYIRARGLYGASAGPGGDSS